MKKENPLSWRAKQFFEYTFIRARAERGSDEKGDGRYYPFGLTMAGISDKALKSQYHENKYRFNDGSELQNKEFFDESGLELYTTDHRLYDPQLGRFWQIDPFSNVFDSWAPYTYATDNPILMNDPTGLLSDTAHPQELATVTVTNKPRYKSSDNIVFSDLRPQRKNPLYILGGNQPAYIHYTPTKHWDWRILQRDKPFFQAVAVGASLIPISKGLRALYGVYKVLQKIEEDPIPETAETVADNALTRNGAAMKGWKGGGKFKNEEGVLPDQDASGTPITYKEYDVWPKVPGQNRGAERVVVGSDKSAWYTNDHYQSFTQIRGN